MFINSQNRSNNLLSHNKKKSLIHPFTNNETNQECSNKTKQNKKLYFIVPMTIEKAFLDNLRNSKVGNPILNYLTDTKLCIF